MAPERIIAALVGALLLRSSFAALRRANRGLGSPIDVLALFLGVWGAVLVVFAIPVIAYTSTGVETWIVIYGSIGTTALGCLAARWLGRGSPAAPVVDQRAALERSVDAARLRLVWMVTTVLGLVGFAAFVYAVGRVASWQVVFRDPSAVRLIKRTSAEFDGVYGFWKLLTYFNQVAFVAWTIALRIGAFRGRWRRLAPVGLVSLVPFVFTADRNLLAAALVLSCALHLLWPWAGSWRRAAIAMGAALLVGGGALTVIGNRYGGSLEGQPAVGANVTWHALDPIAIPYLYLTANLPTFGALTKDELAPFTAGQMTVLPAVKAADRAGLVEHAPVETGVFYPIPFETFSNYSWLGTFWLDFRAPGVLLMPLLVGLIATLTRMRLAAKPAFLTLWTASILLYVMVYSPLSNVLSTSLTWQYLLLGPVIAAILRPGAWRRSLARLRTRPRAVRSLGAAVVCVPVLVALAMLTARRPARAIDATRELASAVEQARYTYAQLGRYPTPLGLATRLGVSRPGVAFRPQNAYTDPLPEPGAIAVFTTPGDVFLRSLGDDGRVYEVHRSERDGVTYGPGTRDP
jgi:hypothetical protein